MAWSRDSHWLTGGGDERIALWRGTELRDEWSLLGAENQVHGPRPRLHVHRNDRGKAFLTPHLEAGSSIRNVTAFDAHTGGCYAALWLPEKRTWLPQVGTGAYGPGLYR